MSPILHEMSWLHMKRDYRVDVTPFYTFGDCGFICRLNHELSGSDNVENRISV